MNKDYILMLEQDAGDRKISSEYFKIRNIPYEFISYSNEVIAFLSRKLIDREPLPKVIILSLHSVPQNGCFVLQEVKDSDHFKHIPIVILGENTDNDMIKKCYEYGANTFVNKPFTHVDTDSKINSFLNYWFAVAETVDTKVLPL
jgi:response regulator RpfG family c-di-GMP phosphodiesterase